MSLYLSVRIRQTLKILLGDGRGQEAARGGGRREPLRRAAAPPQPPGGGGRRVLGRFRQRQIFRYVGMFDI